MGGQAGSRGHPFLLAGKLKKQTETRRILAVVEQQTTAAPSLSSIPTSDRGRGSKQTNTRSENVGRFVLT